MRKYDIDLNSYECASEQRTEITLTADELRALYLLRENHVQELAETASMLDEGQRRLAVRMMKAMVEHRRAMLS